MGKSLLKCLRTVTVGVVALDRVICSLKCDLTRAEERIIFEVDKVFLDRRSARNDLKYRTRLVDLGNALVFPLFLALLRCELCFLVLMVRAASCAFMVSSEIS